MCSLDTFECPDCKNESEAKFTLATSDFKLVTFAVCLYCKIKKGDPRSLRLISRIEFSTWLKAKNDGLVIVTIVE